MEDCMTRKLTVQIYFLCFIVSVFFGTASLAEEKGDQSGNVASVNGVVITHEEVNRQMSFLEKHIESTQGTGIKPHMIPALRKGIINSLIDKELLYQEAKRQKIVIDEKTVDERLDALKAKFPNEKVFADQMGQVNLSEETLKSQIREELAVQRLLEKDVLINIKVSEQDTQSFYDSNHEHFKEPEKVRASHILIKSKPDDDPVNKEERRKKLEAVKERLGQGEDFAVLAKEFSHCPSSEKGGDLGYFARGKMVKPFEEAAFSMKPGEVSDIVVSSFGFHLIKVTDKKPERIISYNESKEKIKQHLQRVKFLEEKNSYVAELKKRGKVELYE
jgi:peptidyl-prolyl cis-trans isomerase C